MPEMSDVPRISVVVPCYNVARWLPRCLDTMLAALPQDGELIAVDDESEDETLAILRTRARIDGRLRVIASVHGGVSSARNQGLNVARGTYLFFVDPDDAVESDFFSAQLNALVRDKADCCICAYCDVDDVTGERHDVSLNGDYRYSSNASIIDDFLPRVFGYSFADVRAWYDGRPLFAGRREMGSACRFVFRRQIVESRHIRFDRDVVLGEDALFISEYLLAAESMTCVDRPLYRTTGRSSGAMRSIPKDGLRYCRNKLAMLRKRESLDHLTDGRLTRLYAASCVFTLAEMLALVFRRRVPTVAGLRIFREYLRAEPVRPALQGFPLSIRRPFLAVTVLLMRIYACF